MPERLARLRGDATRTTRILELGPCHAPPCHAPVRPQARRLEHLHRRPRQPAGPAREIRRLPRGPRRDRAGGAIWAGGPLHQAIHERLHGRFERLIASHVIEHLPDPIAFLASAETLLASHDRPDTGRHSLRTLFLQAAHSAEAQPQGQPGFEGAWGQHPLAARAGTASAYQDAHAWQFTPCAFELAILELAEIGLIDWHNGTQASIMGSLALLLAKVEGLEAEMRRISQG